jgi:predicted transcriptional regulator
MGYFIVKPSTTVGTMKKVISDQSQRVFPIVDDGNIFQGLIYAWDFEERSDTDSASTILSLAKKWSDRNIFVLSSQSSSHAKDILHVNDLQLVPVLDSDYRVIGTIDSSY